jgi:hypothetical protein
MVEKACFLYSTRAWADILKQRGWEYPASASLSSWISLLFERRHEINTTETTITGDGLEEMIESMHEIQKILTDREGVDADKTRHLLEQSHGLVRMLEQAEYLPSIPSMESLYVNGIHWLDLLKANTEDACLGLVRRLAEIKEEKEELEREEENMRRRLENEMKCVKDSTAHGLLRVIHVINGEESRRLGF